MVVAVITVVAAAMTDVIGATLVAMIADSMQWQQ